MLLKIDARLALQIAPCYSHLCFSSVHSWCSGLHYTKNSNQHSQPHTLSPAPTNISAFCVCFLTCLLCHRALKCAHLPQNWNYPKRTAGGGRISHQAQQGFFFVGTFCFLPFTLFPARLLDVILPASVGYCVPGSLCLQGIFVSLSLPSHTVP